MDYFKKLKSDITAKAKKINKKIAAATRQESQFRTAVSNRIAELNLEVHPSVIDTIVGRMVHAISSGYGYDEVMAGLDQIIESVVGNDLQFYINPQQSNQTDDPDPDLEEEPEPTPEEDENLFTLLDLTVDVTENNESNHTLPPPVPCPEDVEELICEAGTSETRTCGEGGLGTQTRTCENGSWGEWSFCVEPTPSPDPVYSNGNGKVRYLFDVGISVPLAPFEYAEQDLIADPIRSQARHYWRSTSFEQSGVGAKYLLSHDGNQVILTGDQRWFESLSQWDNYIKEVVGSTHKILFEDHAFKVISPVTKAEFDKTDQAHALKLMYANIHPNYNYYESGYEEATENISEKVLPNMYAIVSKMLYEHERENPDFYLNSIADAHVTLDGAIDFADFMPLMMPPPDDSDARSSRRISDSPSDRYFKTWAKKYKSVKEEDYLTIDLLDSEFQNIIISHSNFDLLKSYNEKKHMFPMHFEVEFSTDKETDFAELLKDTDLGCTLMKAASRDETIPKQLDEYLASPAGEGVEPGGRQVRRSIDLTGWFNNITDVTPPIYDDPLREYVILGLNNKDMEDDENQFYSNLSAVIMKGKLDKISKNKKRSFEEIMSGKLAHSEAVMYGIEKLDENENVIQYFYLPNSNEIDVQRFIDTQVQYGKYYTYKIYVWQLVYGNKYEYHTPQYFSDSGTVTLSVFNNPSIKLFEVPYYEYSNKIMDKPPVQPNVHLIPFRGVNNKMKINLSPNTGAYNLLPVIFNPEEQDIVDEMLINQERDSGDLEGILEYRSDDEASMYEVYRIDFHPKSYQDFIGKKIRSVNPDVNLDEPGSATSASMHDNLIPNKKYWYTFRSIDNHGHTSYPTPVYRVEIIDDDGAIYPTIEVVDFKEGKLTQNSKSLKKIMQISPAFPQALLDTEDTDTYKLGVREQSVWDKTFKIRLTSKKTGKKVDLKVKFEHNRVD